MFMIRNFKLHIHGKYVLYGVLPVLTDMNNVSTTSEIKEDLENAGCKRLKEMFLVNEWGDLSRELKTVSQTAFLSGFLGFIIGGITNSKTAYKDFLRNNTAESFGSHFEAKRKLQDTITKSFVKGGWKWCWRLCLFSTTFIGIATTISVYRGKDGILEYVIAGTAAGTLYKWQMGPKGWIVGGGLGAVLGLMSGGMTYTLLKAMGLSMKEAREYQQSFSDYRKLMLKEGLKKEKDELFKKHDINIKLNENMETNEK